MCNLFALIKWLLPVLRLTEVTMTGNSLHLAGKMLVSVKLMALVIYAKAGLLRLRPRTLPQDQGHGQGQDQELAVTRPRPQILALGPRHNITAKIADFFNIFCDCEDCIREKINSYSRR